MWKLSRMEEMMTIRAATLGRPIFRFFQATPYSSWIGVRFGSNMNQKNFFEKISPGTLLQIALKFYARVSYMKKSTCLDLYD